MKEPSGCGTHECVPYGGVDGSKEFLYACPPAGIILDDSLRFAAPCPAVYTGWFTTPNTLSRGEGVAIGDGRGTAAGLTQE